MDHVHKGVTGPGLGLISPLKRKRSSCGVCRLRFNSEVQASSHYSGTKHARRLKALDVCDLKIRTSEPVAKETISQILPSPCSELSSSDVSSGDPSEAMPSNGSSAEPAKAPSESLPSPGRGTTERREVGGGEVGPEEETEEEKAVRLLYCSLCKVAVNSASQLQAHNSGTKHKTMLEARSGDGAIKSFPRTGLRAKMAAVPAESLTGLQNKTFHCEICDVHVNSETQLKQHISSRRHKDRAAGKPAKPKFSPFTLAQRHQSFQTIQLALQSKHDLTKPLASTLLQRHLSAAAVMATLGPFPLGPASNPPSPALFQSRALLHAAPGPIRSTHAPVLFTPY